MEVLSLFIIFYFYVTELQFFHKSCICSRGMVLDSSKRVCVDNRKGLCWLKIKNGACESSLQNEVTMAECCSSIGKAWGSKQCLPCNGYSK